MKQNKIKIKAGFSLIELIVAIGLIGVGLLSVASLAAQNVRVQYYNRNSLISSQLAQEGLELARNIRDNNWKATSSTTTLSELFAAKFIVDYTGTYQGYAVASETPPLMIDSSGYYQYVGESTTTFRRFLTSTCVSSSYEYCKIDCYISWQGAGQSGTYQAQGYIYDWQK